MGMTDVRGGRPTADHAAHDPLLIARAASDDDLTPTEQATVAERLATCPECAALHADLVAMAAGLRTDLPLPRRPRDFRLSPEVLVHGPSWRERLSRGLVGPAMRPLAAAICAFGLLLAVTGSVMPRSTATPALSNTGSAVTDQSVPAAAPGSSVQAGGPAAVATPAASALTRTAPPRPAALARRRSGWPSVRRSLVRRRRKVPSASCRAVVPATWRAGASRRPPPRARRRRAPTRMTS